MHQRACRKDVFPFLELWYRPSFWAGSIYDPTTRQPNELACHRAVQNDPRVPVVEMRGSEVDERNYRYWIYTSWCQHGSLGDLVRWYDEHGMMPPEAFIWEVAEALVEAGMAMSWNDLGEVVHRCVSCCNFGGAYVLTEGAGI